MENKCLGFSMWNWKSLKCFWDVNNLSTKLPTKLRQSEVLPEKYSLAPCLLSLKFNVKP